MRAVPGLPGVTTPDAETDAMAASRLCHWIDAPVMIAPVADFAVTASVAVVRCGIGPDGGVMSSVAATGPGAVESLEPPHAMQMERTSRAERRRMRGAGCGVRGAGCAEYARPTSR